MVKNRNTFLILFFDSVEWKLAVSNGNLVKKNGFTLIELLIVISIVGILVSLAISNFMNILQREKVDALAREIAYSVSVARSAAIKTDMPVFLCATVSGESCSNDWSSGWVAFYDVDRNGSMDKDEPKFLRYKRDKNIPSVAVVSVEGKPVSAVRFNFRGAPDSALRINLASGRQTSSLSVTPFGRARINE